MIFLDVKLSFVWCDAYVEQGLVHWISIELFLTSRLVNQDEVNLLFWCYSIVWVVFSAFQLQLFFVSCHSKPNIFGFWTDRTRHLKISLNFKDLWWACFFFFYQFVTTDEDRLKSFKIKLTFWVGIVLSHILFPRNVPLDAIMNLMSIAIHFPYSQLYRFAHCMHYNMLSLYLLDNISSYVTVISKR